MDQPLQNICAAAIPRDTLVCLAELRCVPGIRVLLRDDLAWVRWEPGATEVLARLFPVTGVQFYQRGEQYWFRHGGHLPAFDFPDMEEFRPLHAVLLPAPVVPVPPPPLELPALALTLVPDERPHQTTALLCPLAELARWADTVPTLRLATLRACYHNEVVLVLGERLPLVPGGERFWGERVLVPLGWRLEPDLPESAICTALQLAKELLVLSQHAAAQSILPTVLAPLTRAGLRLALREVRP